MWRPAFGPGGSPLPIYLIQQEEHMEHIEYKNRIPYKDGCDRKEVHSAGSGHRAVRFLQPI